MLVFYLSLIADEQKKSDFEELYYHYREKMFSVAFHYLRQREDAEDAVQEAFIVIAQNMEKLDEPVSPRTGAYVCTVVKNKALDLLRRRKRMPESAADLLPTDVPDADNVAEEAAEGDLLRRVIAYVSAMPPTYREVLMLYFLYDMKPRQIALSLSKSLATVRSLLRRGITQLQTAFPEVAV